MSNFLSENNLKPSLDNKSDIKEIALCQYYINRADSTGIQLVINRTTGKLLPENNAFNVQSSILGLITFKDTNKVIFNKNANYLHTVVIDIKASIVNRIDADNNCTIVIDIIDSKTQKSLRPNAIMSKNVNADVGDKLYLSFIHRHIINDINELRFLGNRTDRVDITLSILSINWTICEI